MKRKWLLSMLCFALLCYSLSPLHVATANTGEQHNPADERMRLYIGASALSNIPWEYFAAIDQYERTMSKLHKHDQDDSLIAIRIAERRWSGALNPSENDDHVAAIRFFDGFGRDGDGDGRADRTNGADTLQALAEWLMRYGASEQEVRIGLWDYYENLRSVQRIMQFAEVYRTYRTLDVHESVFPLPVTSHYTYRSTWGAARGWGGRRIHEGTDLFAPYGVPVRSTNFGVIETIGWNKFGGWRVGIRDMNNVYHYFAHLSGFEKSLAIGDTVKPGTVVGWVGSSGYGAPGTSGKFPPHLHYGTYRDHGMSDWAFDPYPKLRASERAEKSKR